MRTRLPLAVGVVVPLIFVVVLLIEGLTRPGYNSWRDMGSSLSTGPGGWVQIVNFIACGLLIMVPAAALARSHPPTTWGPRLITIFGLSLVIAGAFTTDPANGYPRGTPAAGGPQTWHGTIHDLNAFLAFGSITAAAFVFGRAFARDPHARGWARYSHLTTTASLLLFAASLTAAVLDQDHLWHNAPGGFLQRLAIIVAWGWLSLLSLRALRSRAGGTAGHGRSQGSDPERAAARPGADSRSAAGSRRTAHRHRAHPPIATRPPPAGPAVSAAPAPATQRGAALTMIAAATGSGSPGPSSSPQRRS